MKKILVLGGTQFLGRVFLEQVVGKEGYEMVLFNRGVTNSHLFPELRKIKGNRRTDEVEQLGKEDWDVVIDFSGYFPDPLEKLLQVLKAKAGRYIFISTASVYDFSQHKGVPVKEQFPLLTCSKEQRVDTSMRTYGQRKVACEEALLKAQQQDGLDVVILRPSIVYGKYDLYDRHYYWFRRVWAGNPILLPNNGQTIFNATFVHDLANIIEEAIHIEQHSTIYNTTTHPVMTLKEMVTTIGQILGKPIEFVSAESTWLKEQGVKEWQDLPLWTDSNILQLNHDQLLQDFKLTLTPFSHSIFKTATYYENQNWYVGQTGMDTATEVKLIKHLVNN